MPKISNMPDMGDIDVPDDKPKKKQQGINGLFDPNMSADDIANQIVSSIMGGGFQGIGSDDSDDDDAVSDLEDELGLEDATVEQIIHDFSAKNGGSLNNVPLETIVQHFMIELQKDGIQTELAGDPDEKDEVADLLAAYMEDKGIPYSDGGDGQYILNLISLLQNNGRTANPNMTLTEAEFYSDKLSTLIQNKLGGDSDEIFDEVYSAILGSDGRTVPNLQCGETGQNLVADLLTIYDALTSAASSVLGSNAGTAPQQSQQAPMPQQASQPQPQQPINPNIEDEDAVREVLAMANGGIKLPEAQVQNILATYDVAALNQMASDYNNGDDWSDGGTAYENLMNFINGTGTAAPNPQTSGASQASQPQQQASSSNAAQNNAPQGKTAPKLLPFSDPKRITHIAGYLCKTDQDIENEMLGAIGNPSKDDKSAYSSSGLEQLDCANKDEVDFTTAIAGYQRFYICSNTDKFILCRTVSEDDDNVGFDFAVFKGADDKLHVYVPLMFNTIRQDGEPIKITDYVPAEILAQDDDSDEDDSGLSGMLAQALGGAGPFGSSGNQSGSNLSAEDIVKKNIAKYHRSVIAKYDQRKTEAYCNLAIKEKTFVSMCVKDFGTLEKKVENKQYLHGFVYVGDITPKKDDIDVGYFISDHALDAKKDKYEFYVKLSTTELLPDDLAMLKPIIADIDYVSDPISNIDLESDGEIVFISIPIVYYLKK